MGKGIRTRRRAGTNWTAVGAIASAVIAAAAVLDLIVELMR